MATRNAINVLIKLLGGPEMVAELEKLGKSGEKAFKEIEGAANKVNLAKLGGALNEFGTSFVSTMKFAALAVTGLTTVAAAAAPAILLLANAGAKAADGVGKAAQATGLQTEAFQKFQFAAEQAGVSGEQFVGAMSRFSQEVVETANRVQSSSQKISGSFSKANRDIQQGISSSTENFKEIGVQVTRFGEEAEKSGKKAAKGAKETSDAFAQLGIKVRDAAGNLKSNEQLLLEVAEAFERMPDGAQKSAIAVDLFGQAGARLIPFLNEGADGIRRLSEEAEELGIIFTDDQIRAARQYNDAVGKLQKAITALRNQVGLLFVPALTQAANAFRNAIIRNRDAILAFAEGAISRAVVLVKDFILALSGDDANVENKWIIEWRDAIVQFGKDFVAVVQTVIIPAVKALSAAAGLAADAINAVFNTNVSAGQASLLASLLAISGGFTTIWKAAQAAVEAIALFSRAFVANPILAGVTAIVGVLALWAIHIGTATSALGAHQSAVNNLTQAYTKAKAQVEAIAQSVRDRMFLESQEALKKNEQVVASTIDAIVSKLAQFEGALDRSADPIFELGRQLGEGEISLLDFQAAVDRLAVENPQLSGLAQQIAGITQEGRASAEAAKELNDWIGLLSGKLTNAEFLATKTGEAFRSIVPPADVAKPLDDTAAAADKATTAVSNLGRQITVVRGGEQGLSKEVFDVVDGIVQRAQTTKTALDGVAQSAQQAGQQVQNVSNEVTNSVRDAVPPDAAAAPVDQVVSDVERIAPAAQQAASDTNAALSNIGNVSNGASSVAQAILQPFEQLQSRISIIFNSIRQIAQNGFQSIAALVSRLAAQIQSEINRIIAALRRAAAEAARLRAQARSSGSGRDESGGPGLAFGGPVRGIGGPRSDSNLYWLSNGEFVVQAAAVRKLGLSAMYAINRGILPGLSKIRGLATGGLAGLADNFMSNFQGRFDLAPAMSGFSPSVNSQRSRPFTLVLADGREIGGLTANESAIEKMQEFALTSKMLSAGRKPGRGK